MTAYTITVYLNDDQQRQLDAITAAINQQQEGEPRDAAATFNMIMQTGIDHAINERLKMWGEQFIKGGRQQE